jgi:hypothetical protein
MVGDKTGAGKELDNALMVSLAGWWSVVIPAEPGADGGGCSGLDQKIQSIRQPVCCESDTTWDSEEGMAGWR